MVAAWTVVGLTFLGFALATAWPPFLWVSLVMGVAALVARMLTLEPDDEESGAVGGVGERRLRRHTKSTKRG